MKKKTLSIKSLKVNSFVTGTTDKQDQEVKGGYMTHGCTAGWNGCNNDTNGCNPGGSERSCVPNPMYTHLPCDTFFADCSPCR